MLLRGNWGPNNTTNKADLSSLVSLVPALSRSEAIVSVVTIGHKNPVHTPLSDKKEGVGAQMETRRFLWDSFGLSR